MRASGLVRGAAITPRGHLDGACLQEVGIPHYTDIFREIDKVEERCDQAMRLVQICNVPSPSRDYSRDSQPPTYFANLPQTNIYTKETRNHNMLNHV